MGLRIIFKTMILIAFLLFINSLSLLQPKQRFSLINYGPNMKLGRLIEKNLNQIIGQVNSIFIKNENIKMISDLYTEYGFVTLKDIINNFQIFFNQENYSNELIYSIEDDCYQVQDMAVQINIKKDNLNSIEYLVFDFDNQGKMKNVRINSGWKEVDFDTCESVYTPKIRYKVKNFLQDFSNAYYNKDSTYIEKIFDDNAQIIIGHVLRDTITENLDTIEFPDYIKKNVKLIFENKKEYLKRLKEVFKKNAVIEVNFNSVIIKQKLRRQDFFGVTLFQTWKSSTYSDRGWLFLLLDFRNPDRPILVHKRIWHPEYFLIKPPILMDDIKIYPPIDKLKSKSNSEMN